MNEQNPYYYYKILIHRCHHHLRHSDEHRDKHVSDEDGKVFDIGPNESSHSGNDRTCYNKSITILEGGSLHGNSKLYGEGGENAYHIVLK